jgi:5-methylcytosine-specific restriction endonuclease McrA
MPKRRPKLDNRGIRERDKAICQVTGQYAPDGNVDHMKPKSRGGAKKSWENMVWMKRELNSVKGNRTIEEMGWKLIRRPEKPKEKDICLLIPPRHPDWLMFLPAQK